MTLKPAFAMMLAICAPLYAHADLTAKYPTGAEEQDMQDTATPHKHP